MWRGGGGGGGGAACMSKGTILYPNTSLTFLDDDRWGCKQGGRSDALEHPASMEP